MKIQETAENYLETILILSKNGKVRSIDIANALGYSKPTISVAMKQFRENGYILTDSDGYITLTQTGLAVAERMYKRHEKLAGILMKIGVSKETAYKDACKIEHDISDETFECILKYEAEIK